MEEPSLYAYGLAGLTMLIFLITKLLDHKRPNLDFIPSIGPSGRLTSYFGAYKFVHKGLEMVQEGYHKYHPAMFKVPLVDRWVVVVSGPKLINDMRQARDEDLSFRDAVNETIQMRYTIGSAVIKNTYHVRVVQSQLTRNLGTRFSDIQDEIVKSFDDAIPLHGNDWTSVPTLNTIMQIVCRTSNRLFVGLPLCRDPDYRDLNIRFAVDVFNSAAQINLFPKVFRPIVGPIFSPLSQSMRRARKHLGSLIELRLKQDAEYGTEWAERPNDLISWLLDEAKGDERMVHRLITRVLLVNFAAIHTSSNSFTQALYHLAASPEYVQPMREEVETVIKQDGWTKSSMGKMRKVDSFLRESQRFNGLGCFTMNRKVVNPSGFTFSDGTTLPVGTFVAAAAFATHHEEATYTDPYVFDGFRFANMREGDGEGIKHQMVSTNVDYIPFGHGRHSCPGRFFAANELKAMLAHTLLTYDIKLENEGLLPPSQWFGANSVPHRTAHVLFRKRQL